MLPPRERVAVLVLLAVLDAAAPFGAHPPSGGLAAEAARPRHVDVNCAMPSARVVSLLGRWLEGKPGNTVAAPNWNSSKFQRSRRAALPAVPPPPHGHHDAEMDSHFLHVPRAAVDNFPDGGRACEALRNASVLQQVLPVVVEPPCPVTLKAVVDPKRVWPSHLLAAECSCPGASCRSRSAFVCTQVFSPVVVVTLDPEGGLRQHRKLIASGCRCMSARATLAEDEDFK